jgi:hypothetical protein
MRFKIPQNVQTADKIVGPLTLKQLIIIGVGFGIDYFLYISLSQLYVLTVWILPVLFIAIVTVAVAFVKIKGIPFLPFLLLSIEFYMKPSKRVWSQGGGDVLISVTQPKPKSKEELEQAKQQQKPVKDLSNLEDLTKILDTRSDLLEEKKEKQEGLQNLIEHKS